MRSPCFAFIVALAAATGLSNAPAQDRDDVTLRLGLQAVGTFSWVVHAMQHFGVDEAYDLDLAPTTYGTKQATELALREGSVDVVVDDFIGVALMRERGMPVLMEQLLREGEIDAAVPYWHFVSRMRATAPGRVTASLDLAQRLPRPREADDVRIWRIARETVRHLTGAAPDTR